MLDLRIQLDALFSEIAETSSPDTLPLPPIVMTPSPEFVSPIVDEDSFSFSPVGDRSRWIR